MEPRHAGGVAAVAASLIVGAAAWWSPWRTDAVPADPDGIRIVRGGSEASPPVERPPAPVPLELLATSADGPDVAADILVDGVDRRRVALGGEAVPGLRLVRVGPDEVELRGPGGRVVTLVRPRAAPSPGPSPSTADPGGPPLAGDGHLCTGWSC